MIQKFFRGMSISFVLISFISNFMYGAIPAQERAALIALYNSTNGDSWTNKSGWKTPPLHTDGFAMPGTEGSWYGVTVQGDHVTILEYLRNHLTGSIPSSIEDLTGLKELNLHYNQIGGSIPIELGNINSMQSIYMEANQLSGSIPPELGNLVNLKKLHLARNQLSGSIPSEIGNLSNLEYLWLDANQLSGNLPASLGNLRNLKDFCMFDNQISGSIPPEIGNCTNMNAMCWSNNQLNGNIPSSLGNLIQLQHLSLNNNHLHGEIPTSLTNLINITEFYIEYNCLQALDPTLRAWLDTREPGWETHQDQCGSISITSPNGSESWIVGSSHSITWTSTDTGGNVKIEYTANNGTSWTTIISSTANTGSYPWTVPNTPSPNCMVRISEASAGIPSDSSNSTFSIVSITTPTITVTSPNGGEVWAVGSTQNITWTSTGTVGNVKIQYTANNGSGWSTVTSSTANDGSYSWTVPNTPSSNCKVRICEAPDGIPSDSSNSIFSIVSETTPTITVTSPNGGEVWAVGSMQNITWTSTGTVGHVKIQYTANNSTSWSTVTSSTANNGSYSWTVPNTVSSQCKIKISEAADGIPADTSNAVFTIYSATLPGINLNRTRLNYGATTASIATGAQKVLIDNSGGGTLDWSIGVDVSWLVCTPGAGIGNGVITISVFPAGLAVGNYKGTITVSDPNATNSPQTISVELEFKHHAQDLPVFGEFSTPVDGSIVSSSIPVTGWVLDDVGIQGVKIYREDGQTLVFIGDAVLIEGARPDVEAAYPDYPLNYKAGWGYMLLTNFLPNQGNGVFKLHAVATDMSGQSTDLGIKTITADNAHAVKPFGALDTPAPGGTASGKNFANWGWVLTPQPNYIPTNGSTIDVWVDGVFIGHPAYNNYREDIAALFPGYANSKGAVGCFYLDTTSYGNGVHTLFWTATDNAGNSDGIGSRYFNVLNIVPGPSASVSSDNTAEPGRNFRAARVKKGYNTQINPVEICPDEEGFIYIECRELERMEILLKDAPSGYVTGYLVVGDEQRPLPIGSTLDSGRGVFYWQPGVGFIGKYHFVFIEKDDTGLLNRKDIIVNICPKFPLTDQ